MSIPHGLPKIIVLGGSKSTSLFFFVIGLKFSKRGSDRNRSSNFPIVDIVILSGDIRDRSVKLSEIALNYTPFWPPFFGGGGWGGEPWNFQT